MIEGLIPIGVLIFTTASSSLALYVCLSRFFIRLKRYLTVLYLVVAILAATISTILFQMIGYFVTGYLDPFYLIALVSGWLISFILSLIMVASWGILCAFRNRSSKNP